MEVPQYRGDISLIVKARQTRFVVSHQRLLPLRPAASTVIIAVQAVTRPPLIAVALWICRVSIAFASNE